MRADGGLGDLPEDCGAYPKNCCPVPSIFTAAEKPASRLLKKPCAWDEASSKCVDRSTCTAYEKDNCPKKLEAEFRPGTRTGKGLCEVTGDDTCVDCEEFTSCEFYSKDCCLNREDDVCRVCFNGKCGLRGISDCDGKTAGLNLGELVTAECQAKCPLPEDWTKIGRDFAATCPMLTCLTGNAECKSSLDSIAAAAGGRLFNAVGCGCSDQTNLAKFFDAVVLNPAAGSARPDAGPCEKNVPGDEPFYCLFEGECKTIAEAAGPKIKASTNEYCKNVWEAWKAATGDFGDQVDCMLEMSGEATGGGQQVDGATPRAPAGAGGALLLFAAPLLLLLDAQ